MQQINKKTMRGGGRDMPVSEALGTALSSLLLPWLSLYRFSPAGVSPLEVAFQACHRCSPWWGDLVFLLADLPMLFCFFCSFVFVLFCFVCSSVAWYVDEMVLTGVVVDDSICPHKDVPHHKAILQMVEPGIPVALIVDLIAF